MWLCVLFTISYAQQAVTRSTSIVYLMISKGISPPEPAEGAFFQFHDEVGFYALNAATLLVSLLILAVFKPKYRHSMMGVAITATLAVSTGLLEKLVYFRWAGSNETLLMAETVRASTEMAAMELGTWVIDPAAVIGLGWMMRLDLSVLLLSSIWAIVSWRIAAARVAALHRSAGAA